MSEAAGSVGKKIAKKEKPHYKRVARREPDSIEKQGSPGSSRAISKK